MTSASPVPILASPRLIIFGFKYYNITLSKTIFFSVSIDYDKKSILDLQIANQPKFLDTFSIYPEESDYSDNFIVLRNSIYYRANLNFG